MRRALLLAALLAALLPASAGAQEDSPACDLQTSLEYPREGAIVGVGVPLGVEGWAIDRAAPAGTGILSVQVALDVPRDQGGTAVMAVHAEERPDVARQLGDEGFRWSGYRVDVPTADLEMGVHTLYVDILTRCGWHTETRDVLILPRGETTAHPARAAPCAPSSPT